MPKTLYPEGQRLIPLYATEERKNGHIVWMFLCKCGNQKAIRKDYVDSGRAKSCGCFYRRRQIRDLAIERKIGSRKQFATVCAVCGIDRKLERDHDHKCCGQKKMCEECVRGWLCENHNKALGLFKDNIEHLQKAIEYLRRFNGTGIK
jgi:hypothetical protein